ncbi:Enoyl-CoA hydratase [isoleucine degradation] / 3-hydroxyacyl-CoA dehydrogenase / 3-hydroxybutyryl-CoA epimerase [Alloalcanivorax xenomutans]|uniref:3-hydroxyacyl-CoA dehydrogenase NAD-binding domain-containing protein n=1 Tax=Alloalcanivorax xenomutans TaxID=1094342 RepID=UPI0006D5BF74|nr:3-hydroxyacyl-CoA dehydrogenase NAD-binding domain-containing protein [Alloalcanivorax xenomutans]PHS67765.1 MAG: 3-hydroxyacyl-CoA dehydrogenase [Alcanivorax sp.]CUR45716.1 Enoyl-CoA hydratase [isoleucine degradation] / 3-hydroxyacyl-CoA dehydrogenase / 3-hydroxybutyryl-CoA epimerase [Alloalcanivorax xenomutans]
MNEQTSNDKESTIRWEQGADNIVTLVLDDPKQSANTMNERYMRSMAATVERLEKEKDNITGVIITSAKSTFFAGGDLNDLIQVTPERAAEFSAGVETAKAQLRTLETLGIPVVAALNGTALGGGLEIALACHRRIALNNPKAVFGLPEVTLGLLPGGGGVVRTVRMLGIQNALMQVLLQGQRHKVDKAKALGLVDEVVDTPEAMLEQARAWIKANPKAKQPWDEKGYKIPGGSPSHPGFAQNLPAFPANLRKQLKGANYPAPRNILAAAVEGAQVDFDNAIKIEGRYFVELACGQVAKNMTTAFFFNLQAINAGASRPKDVPKYTARKVAVLGAGMMGAGIAYVTARSGAEVVLKDVSLENAEKGKAYSEKLLDKAVSKGKMSKEKKEEILSRITPSADVKDLQDVDFVIEAVFENTELKHKVFQEIEDVVNADAVLGSNTSTLPITGLAEGVKKQENFIGIHFFSPVDKMPLVEIIRGENTSDEVLAKVFDYTLQINKTPIVVNDSRGFFTSRVIGTFINEAIAMVGEGQNANSIEQAATQAGYPVGALKLIDEINMKLSLKIAGEYKQAAQAQGDSPQAHPALAVMEKMVNQLERPGKLDGKGFYDYPENGKAHLWAGLKEQFPAREAIPFKDMQERMLFAEALETVKCFQEGVIESVGDTNIGSIFGIGFPAWSGGVVQYMNQYEGGLRGFVARAEELADRYGERFNPPPLLVEKAEKGEIFK